jgi:hypothetical protein
MSAPVQTWDTEEAARLAREAYRYVGRTYPRRDEELETLRAFHGEHGIPPAGYFSKLLWWIRAGG